MRKSFVFALVGMALMASGCATSTTVRIGGTDVRRDDERLDIRGHAEEMALLAANRAGTTTIRYKMAEFSGSRPKARLKDEVESQVISALLEYILRAGIERLLAEDPDKRISRR